MARPATLPAYGTSFFMPLYEILGKSIFEGYGRSGYIASDRRSNGSRKPPDTLPGPVSKERRNRALINAL